MNLYSVAIEIVRRFVVPHRAPGVVKKRTYVFVLVPVDFSKNGAAKKVEIAQDLINDHSNFERAANYTLTTPMPLGRPESPGATEATGEANVESEPQLDSRLMWTWFLPNPLWKPKQRE
jgi:hypothetical protein